MTEQAWISQTQEAVQRICDRASAEVPATPFTVTHGHWLIAQELEPAVAAVVLGFTERAQGL